MLSNSKQLVRLLSAVLAVLTPGVLQAQHYAEENGWNFDNFDTPTFGWDLYRDTFIGIPPNRSHVDNVFETLFYDLLYSTELGSQGNCYGMSLMSLHMVKKGGHLGFCAPCRQYSGAPGDIGPSEPLLLRAINELHGYQVNLPTLRFILELIAQSKNRDGKYAWTQAQYYHANSDPTLVSITEDLNPANGGHTMVCYRADMWGGKRTLWVYDPNRFYPNDAAWYTGFSNRITVENDGSWSFTMAGGGVWSGSPSSGGNILISPLSIVGPRARTPVSMGLDAATVAVSTFIFGDGAQLEQITDGDGKRLYLPGSFEVDVNPATGMGNTLPFHPSDQTLGRTRKSLVRAYFTFGRPKGRTTYSVKPGARGYAMSVGTSAGSLVIRSKEGGHADTIQLLHGAAPTPQVKLMNASGSDSYEVELTQYEPGGTGARVYHLSNLTMPQRGSVTLTLAARGDAGLTVQTDREARYNLTLRRTTGLQQTRTTLQDVTVQRGKIQKLRPRDWGDLYEGSILLDELPIREPNR